MLRVDRLLKQLSPSVAESKAKPTAETATTSRFRYTLDDTSTGFWTEAQREFYEENGYIVIKGFLNSDEVAKFYNRFEELVKNPEIRPAQMVVMRDVALPPLPPSKRTNPDEVTKLQNWSREPELWKYCCSDKMKRVISTFCGNDIRAMHFMVINKPKDSGMLSSRHPFHQDQWYFPFGPCDRTVCSWTALEKVHRRNGCLSVVPGSHRNEPGGKLLNHGQPKWSGPANHSYHAIQPDGDPTGERRLINQVISARVHLEMDPGDTVFFHPLLIHASGANLTAFSRRSISCHFTSSTLSHYYHEFELPAQKLIADSVKEMLSKSKTYQMGQDIPFTAVWGIKSRQVCGKEGNLSLAKSFAKKKKI